MNKTSRLIGVDLCRGLAAFAVILVHSGDESWGLPISDRAIQFRYLFYYAVPFFLAASFYFNTRKLPVKLDLNFWQKKWQRVILPYLLWSLFYVISKTVVFTLNGNSNEVQELLADPIAIIFLGAASYHLYFMPLLLTGIALLYLSNYFIERQDSIAFLSLLLLVAIISYQLLMLSGNDFDLGAYLAFPQLLQYVAADNLLYQPWRVLLVSLAWLFRCFPYFFAALLLNQLLELDNLKWLDDKENVVAIFLFFLLIDITGEKFLPGALNEVLLAYSFLLFGITVSRHLPDSKIVQNLGLCSFGIYLIHPFVKSAVEIFLIKFVPQTTQSVSILSILIYTILSFLLSWVSISIMQRNKLVAQYI